MEAAKIAESRTPESNAGNRLLTIYIKIRLLLPSSRYVPRYSCPTSATAEAIIKIRAVQVLPTIQDFFISFSERMDM